LSGLELEIKKKKIESMAQFPTKKKERRKENEPGMG
jgi:hypothetical protein